MSGLTFALIKSHSWVFHCVPSHILKNYAFIVIFDHPTTNSYFYPSFCLCNQNKNWETMKSRTFLTVTWHVLEKPWFAGYPALYRHILYLLFECRTILWCSWEQLYLASFSFICYYAEQLSNILYLSNINTKYQNTTFWPLVSSTEFLWKITDHLWSQKSFSLFVKHYVPISSNVNLRV